MYTTKEKDKSGRRRISPNEARIVFRCFDNELSSKEEIWFPLIRDASTSDWVYGGGIEFIAFMSCPSPLLMLSIFDGTEEQHSGRPLPHDDIRIYNSQLRDTQYGKAHDTGTWAMTTQPTTKAGQREGSEMDGIPGMKLWCNNNNIRCHWSLTFGQWLARH